MAEERHFRRGAERLQIAEPAVSRQIRALEQELGVELLDRGSRPLRLTAAGSALLEEATLILHRTRRAHTSNRTAAILTQDERRRR